MTSWMKDRRVIVASTLALLAVLCVVRNLGVREVDRARESVNFAVIDPRPAPGDWPWWRGTHQTNTVPHERPAVHWSPTDSRGWQIPVSGRGRTALALWGDQLFVPTVDADRGAIDLLSINPESGRLNWQTELHRGELASLTPRGSPASPTPACDGQHVFMVCPTNGTLSVSAVDLTGRVVWQRDAGPYFSKWGYSSSPAIYKSLVIVAADNKGSRINRLMGASYLAALHRQSGEVVWRVHRPEADSFGTPVIAHLAGRDQLVIAGRDRICSYDPLTGKPLWNCQWAADRVSNSVAFDDSCVYATTRHHQPETICVRADGAGDVTNTHVVWRSRKSAADLPSPVVHQGRVYLLSDDGLLNCLDAANGKTIWKRHLPGVMSATPVVAGNHLYCGNDEGTLFVLELDGHGELAAEIPLPAGILVSPIVSHNRLYLRTIGGIHCVPPDEAAPLAAQPDSPRRKF